MSDEGKAERPGRNEEPSDEVEAHSQKAGMRLGETDEAEKDDEVEAHGKAAHPKKL